MYPRVSRELWMETRAKHVALSYRNDVALLALVTGCGPAAYGFGIAWKASQDLDSRIEISPRDLVLGRFRWRHNCVLHRFLLGLLAVLVCQQPLDDGSPNEDAVKWCGSESIGVAAAEKG